MDNNTFKIIFYGLLAALFFSSTFILNRFLALESAHWFWSASLRYFYIILLLAFGFIAFKGITYLKNLFDEFLNHFKFWTIAGSIGFGVFYALICYVADNAPAWVVATTWQFTIIASLFILSFFGKKISKSAWFFITLLFIGILMINFEHLNINDLKLQILSIGLIVIASFAYPIGNQLVWELNNKEDLLPKRKDILNNSFAKLFLLSIGSLPFWFILSLFFDVGTPSKSQYASIFLVAIFSGIIATSLFLYARAKANSSVKLALIDATQSGEVIFTLILEMIFLGVVLPSTIGIFGIVLAIGALVSLALV